MITNCSAFAPEVAEYMRLNGYTLIDNNNDLGLLTFVKGDISVLFWQDRIERRIISPDKNAVTRQMRSYKGFDGKDIFELMMILHFLKAVDLRDVKKEVYKKVNDRTKSHFSELLNVLA